MEVASRSGVDVSEITVGVCIPAIPIRMDMLKRALASVASQSWPPNQISIVIDHAGEGAAATRNKALKAIETDWVAFLDDDDEFLPRHLERCFVAAQQSGADFVYSWFEGINQDIFAVPNEDGELADPFAVPWHEGSEAYMRQSGNFIPVTVMVRTELIKSVGGFEDMAGSEGSGATGEDYIAWLKLLDAGAKFVHVPERTWRWNGHVGHTAGRSWKAAPGIVF